MNKEKKATITEKILFLLVIISLGVMFYVSNHCFVMNVYHPGEGYSIVGSMLFAYATICALIIVKFSFKIIKENRR